MHIHICLSRDTPILAYIVLWSGLGIAQTVPSQRVGPSNLIEIDASQSSTPPQPSDFTGGSSMSPSGVTLGVNDQYLTLDGKPWLPVMGEFHFSRYPANGWEEQILKMKAAGVQIISSYIFWNHIEEQQGIFDWTGQRDLRRFVKLCRKHGMYFYLRVGPWAHGESRYGGFPDWVVKKSVTRTTDPRFLGFVDLLYRQVGMQVKGLLWKDGGPLIGVQIENEYGGSGANGGPAYIHELKRMALAAGLDTPLYSVTGWDNAVWPPGEFLPVYGGYPDAPWDPGNAPIPPGEVYLFRFHSRISGNMGFIGGGQSQAPQSDPRSPFLTAEVGGGIQDTYHRRPVVSADDIAAMVPVMIGSGANMLGYYMFQGGENPDGRLGPLNESKATGYPSDLPVKSYDFQAPLSEFGREQNAYGDLKIFNYFLNDFGSALAPMAVHAPALLPTGPADKNVLRVAARTTGDSGFLFLNNHVRHLDMSEQRGVQIQLRLPSGPMLVPSDPIDIPAGSYAILPINMDLDGMRLRYGTVQPLCHIANDQTVLYVFTAVPGITPELSFAADSASFIEVKDGIRNDRPGQLLVSDIEPSTRAVVEGISPQGKRVVVIVLTHAEAQSITRVSLRDGEHLMLSSQEVYSDGKALTIHAFEKPDFHFSAWPLLHSTKGSTLPLENQPDDGIFKSYRSLGNTHEIRVSWTRLHSKTPVALPHTDPATVPSQQEIEAAPRWKISPPKGAFSGVADLFLEVTYSGDIARLRQGNHLLTDNFYNGTPWVIGLKRFRRQVGAGNLELSIVPWRENSNVVLEGDSEMQIVPHRAQLLNVTVSPEFQLIIP